MLDKVKIALGIDTEDTYFDTYLETLILASESYIKELIPTEITEELRARYEICVLALVTYMFNNREMEVEGSVSSNKVIKSLLSSLRFRGENNG
ncbi:MAG: head-tail connector protein [Clostridium celatum]|nr:head-tail connector protein [Clostridium celatum]MDU4979856.1 head-tail connector protein [Clostridium celatum]